MMRVRPGDQRGHFDHGWLQTWHSFSFADYQDPEHMGFETLRVINQDRVAPGQGFAPHGHRDMEILTYVTRGVVEHQDSMGNTERVPAGDVQRMTAGTGVQHSEFNPAADEPLELLQIWILPEQQGLEPGYEQRSFAGHGAGLQLIASRSGRDDSLTIHQDVDLWAARLKAGEAVTHAPAPGRSLWLQVVEGALEVGPHRLQAGDGLAVRDEDRLQIAATAEAELLLFDLAPGPLGSGAAG